jgi:hypothetical protein
MNSKHISSYMKNTKKTLNTLLAIVVFTAPILCANPSQSLSNYPSHAHPFRKIGSSYSQSAGDAQCRKIYKELTPSIITKILVYDDSQIKLNPHYIDQYSTQDIYSYTGVKINNASHVWYHQQNGECVANIGKY